MYPIKRYYDIDTIDNKIKFLKKLNGFVIKQNTLQDYDKLKLLINSFNFDNIILLSRMNSLEAIQSFLHMETNSNTFNSWSTKYNYIESQIDYEYEYTIDYGQAMMKILSDELNIPIIYYEDLYLGNQLKTLENMNLNINVENFLELLKLTKKQRITTNKDKHLL
jgi:oligoribonuclease NrnB/cAMP/cGMP phosphodiesterase (DHH superfamily)